LVKGQDKLFLYTQKLIFLSVQAQFGICCQEFSLNRHFICLYHACCVKEAAAGYFDDEAVFG